MIVKEIMKRPTAKHWQRIGAGNHNGIAVFLPGIRTQQSCGLGEFLDLLPLIDWCSEVGFDIIQLLPLNDNGADISPYNALSAFALNPLLLSLTPFRPSARDPAIAKLKRLNTKKFLPYEEAALLKEGLLRNFIAQHLDHFLHNSDYQQFALEEKQWLEPYALFKGKGDKGDSRFWSIIQFLCHNQMAFVKRYADDKGILIKGDIPILVSPGSVDVLCHPEIFNLAFRAGVPPDQYYPEGQYWGFPLYRWDTNIQEIMKWWIQRLNHSAHYYHLYRLDHVVGLFRIWAIPPGFPAKEGSFIPLAEKEWLPKGKEILTAFLKECPMLPIAEDLGCVPDSVRQCLQSLGIPGTKVIRWEVGTAPTAYSPLSMTTLSTHDTENAEEWWKKFPEEASRYAEERGWPYRKRAQPHQIYAMLEESYRSGSLFHINLLQEVLRPEPSLSWKNAEDDRINIPSSQSNRNWRYRYRASIEQIVQCKPLKNMIAAILGVRP